MQTLKCYSRFSLVSAFSRKLTAFTLMLLASIATIQPVAAQQTTSTLLGTISDSTGASMAGVTIRVTNLATNIQRDVQTDASGSYRIPSLPAGNYRLRVSKEVFQLQQIESLAYRWNKQPVSTLC